MGKKKEDEKSEPKKKKGCIKGFMLLFLVLVMAYLAIHIGFLWRPAGKPDQITQAALDAKIFPAIKPYTFGHIAGRDSILDGKGIAPPLIKERLELAVERSYPVTFSEEEINAWLSKRLKVKQDGMLAPFAKVRGVWVDFKKDEVEIIIEREFKPDYFHTTSLFMKFNRQDRGYSIERHASHIGQVRAPGGFARLIMPAFDNMVKELANDMKVYTDGKIRDVIVKEGSITLDPRKPEERDPS